MQLKTYEFIRSLKSHRFALLTAVLVLIVCQANLWGHTPDDSYILFRYVERFLAGKGPTFNKGEQVEGYSSPLWFLILSAIGYVTQFDPVIMSRVLGLVLMIGSLLLLLRIFDHIVVRNKEFAIWSVVILVVMNPGLQYYAGAGLEGPLLQVLLLALVWFELRYRGLPAALTAGLITITRPEGILYAAGWLLWLIFRRKPKRIAIGALITTAVFGGWEIFRIVYYHAVVANTGIAKSWQGFGDFGAHYLARWTISIVGLILPLLFIRRVSSPRLATNPAVKLMVCLIVANLAFVCYAHGDWMSFGRFVVPALPLIALVLTAWFFNDASVSKRISQVALVLVLISNTIAWYRPVGRYIRAEGYTELMRGSEPLKIGKWIADKFPAGTTVATERIGAIAFEGSDLTIWDFAGLTDRLEAVYRKNQSKGVDPILLRYPDLVAETMVPSELNYVDDKAYLSWLNTYYCLVKEFSEGDLGRMDVWQRKNFPKL